MTTNRHYGMDWLRIGAFQLLILYHVGMAFVPWPFELKMADPPIWWTTIPMLLLNPWRLSLLFLVSGYASAALFRRDPRIGAFVRSRLARLGVPLLFGIGVLVTPQPWVAIVTQQGYRHGFGHYLLHDYWDFKFVGNIAMPTWMHLWFVVYLLAYTLVLGALLCLPDRLRAALRRGLERATAGPLILVVPALYLGLARSLLPPGWSDTHALFDDWSAHAAYFACFLFGWALRGSDALRAGIARWWRVAGALAFGAWIVVAGLEVRYPGDVPAPDALRPLFRVLRTVQMWGAIVGLVGLADAHWNREGRWRATLAEAVFPFYIIHQTIILVVGYWLLPTETGPLARFLILTAATAAGCWAFYLGGREVGWLRPLIGLKRFPPARAAAIPGGVTRGRSTG